MSSAELTREIRAHMAEVGWRVSRVLDQKTLTAAGYARGESGRERLLYAQQHGFAGHFFRVTRETLRGEAPQRGLLRAD